MCVVDRDPPGPAEIDRYFSLHGAKLVRAVCNCKHFESIFATAREWTRRFMGSRAGETDWQEQGGSHGDYVRPFVLLAALERGCGEDRWQTFIEYAGRDVSMAPKDPGLAYALEFDEDEFLKEQLRYLHNQLSDAKQETPHRTWLWQLYRLSFTRFHRNRPGTEPAWWVEILGPAPPPLTPDPPPPPPPPGAPLLPDVPTLLDFVEQERRGHPALESILHDQTKYQTSLKISTVKITFLQFIYLRYRNSPAATRDHGLPPRACDLVSLLNDHGCVSARGGPVTTDNLEQILSREIRKQIRADVSAAIARGELRVGPDPVDWLSKVLPRPSHYVDGELFPPLP